MAIPKTPNAQMRLLVERVAEVMAQHIRSKVPISGDFQNYTVSFMIPKTENRGVLIIEPSLAGTPEQRRLRIGALREGTDRLRSNYLLHDTNENIVKFLANENIVDELIPYYKAHSDKLNKE